MGLFLENRWDIVHKYDHVELRVLSICCTLNRGHTMPTQAAEAACVGIEILIYINEFLELD